MTYAELIANNKDNLIIDCSVIIENNNLRKSYSIYTNLHCDYGISEKMLLNFYSYSKSKFRKRIAEFKKMTGFKIKLDRTNNSENYTRLIYKLEFRK